MRFESFTSVQDCLLGSERSDGREILRSLPYVLDAGNSMERVVRCALLRSEIEILAGLLKARQDPGPFHLCRLRQITLLLRLSLRLTLLYRGLDHRVDDVDDPVRCHDIRLHDVCPKHLDLVALLAQANLDQRPL